MPTSPDSRSSRLAIVGGLLAIAVIGAVFVLIRDDGGTDAVDDASGRTSETAPTVSTDATTPSTASAPAPVASDPAIALEPVSDLPAPTAVVDLAGDGTVLVSTLDGRVHALELATGDSEVVLDLTDEVSTGGERGLLGMAADPAGERLYVDFTDVGGDTDIRSWPLADGRPVGGPTDGVLHLELGQPFSNHNGGNLIFGPDGLLWIGTGDGGSRADPGEVAQDASELLGKMLRVQPVAEGGVAAPDDNPAWGGRPEVWAIGLRNPWRYSFDRATNALWIADVGQNEIEEISVVPLDEPMPNFGWDDVEGDRDFEGTSSEAFVDPVVTYDHDEGCSVTGGFVYRGTGVSSLVGWYLFGDFCGGWIRAVPADDPTSEPTELATDVGGAVGFAELADGELLYLTFDGISRIVAG